MFPNIFGPQVVPKAQGKSYQIYEHNYMGGAWTAPDSATVDQRGALIAQNMQFYNRQTQTRFGWGTAISYPFTNGVNSGGGLSLFNWVSELGNYLLWSSANSPAGSSLYATKVTDNPPTEIQIVNSLTESYVYPTFAPAGPRLYVAWWDGNTTGDVNGTAQAAVVSWNGSTFNYDKIIPGPPTSTLITSSGGNAPSETTAGIVTAGLHNLGVRMLHRSGFLGRPGPDTSTSAAPTPQTFAPVTFTSTGNHNLHWAFTPGGNWPADVVQVQLIMSPVANPNRYFPVPGAVQNVTGGAATAVTFNVNIDDGTLVASVGQFEVSQCLDLYTASASGAFTVPISGLWNIGTRMFYRSILPDALGNNYVVVFASEPGLFQNITLDQNILQLPNQLSINAVFSVQGSIYLGGPHWTYFTQDTGDVPVKWPSPQIVDGRKGPSTPNCVTVATSGLYAWVADKTGVYYFTGAYPDVPISYQQRDLWDKIVIGNTNLFWMRDDPLRHRLIVMSQVSGAPLMVWDYTSGKDAYTSRFSIILTPNNSVGGIEIVQNDLNAFGLLRAPELWLVNASILGGSSTFYIWREKNPAIDAANTLYQDDADTALAIHTIYEPPIFPVPGGDYNFLSHQGAKIRITGSGVMNPKVFTFDKGSSITLGGGGNLSGGPEGKQQYRGYLVGNNGFIYHFEQNAVGAHFTLSEIDMYYSDYGSLL